MNGSDLRNEQSAPCAALAAITSSSVRDVTLHGSLTVFNTIDFHYGKHLPSPMETAAVLAVLRGGTAELGFVSSTKRTV